jgi:hypothetical protein
MKSTAAARDAVDLLQRMTEVELFATRDPAERSALKAEHADLRDLSADIAAREEAASAARRAAWLREAAEEIRICRLLGARPIIHRRGLAPWQKAALIRRLGAQTYRDWLPW